MNKLMIAFVAAVSLFTVGCKKKGGGDDAVKKFGEFKDSMCKCGDGDTACAQKVLDDQKKYGEEMAKTADKDAKPDPELTKKMEPIMADYTKCMTKAMTPKAAVTPPVDDKKPDEKKPDEVKADDKKPDEVKADDKKPDDKKPDDKKPDDKKKDDKKPDDKKAGGW